LVPFIGSDFELFSKKIDEIADQNDLSCFICLMEGGDTGRRGINRKPRVF
jgi:hypothetical protein